MASSGGQEGESLEQSYTQCLQRIDANVVRAIDSATLLVQDAKAFQINVKGMAKSMRAWNSFFDSISKANLNRSSSSSSVGINVSREDAQSNVEPSSASTSDLSSSMHTPRMPVFQTPCPHDKKKGLTSQSSSGSFCSEQGSFLGQLSPETKKMVETYKTPMPKPPTPSRLKNAASVVGGGGSAAKDKSEAKRKSSNEILNISDITPATPGTPDEGFDEDLNSRAAELFHTGTPAKRVAELLLGSGTWSQVKRRKGSTDEETLPTTTPVHGALAQPGALDLSRASSNPATPKFDSPLATQALKSTSPEDKDKENAPKGDINQSSPLRHTSILKKDSKAVSSSKFGLGTPISRAVASNRKRSLTSQLRGGEGSPLSDEESLLDNVVPPALPSKNGFSLDLLPQVFRNGSGAAQVTKVYSHFDKERAYTLEQLAQKLPEFSPKRLELILELFVSVGFLRPFEIDDQLLWRVPTH